MFLSIVKSKFKICGLLLVLIPLFLGLFNIYKYGFNILYLDDFAVFDWFKFFYTDSVPFASFFHPHNEHRIFFPKIFYWLLLKISHADIRVILYFCFVLVTLVFIIFIIYLKDLNKNILNNSLILLLLCCLLYASSQYENFLWGFQISFYFVFCFAIFSFFSFYLYLNLKEDRKNSFTSLSSIQYFNIKKFFILILSILFLVIASFSSAHGLLVGLSFQFVLFLFLNKSFYKNFTFWLFLILNIIIWFVYMHNFSSPDHGASIKFAITHVDSAIKFFLVLLSSPFFRKVSIYSYLFGFFTLIISLSILFKFFKDSNLKLFFPLCILVFGLLVCSSIAVGRAAYGDNVALTSRYTTYPLLIYFAIILVISYKLSYLKVYILAVFFLSYVYSLNLSFQEMKIYSTTLKQAQNNFLNYRDASTNELLLLNFMSAPLVKNVSSLFYHFNVGPFYDQQKIMSNQSFRWFIDENKIIRKENSPTDYSIYLKGWIFKVGKNSCNSKVSILLKNVNNSNWIVLPTKQVQRFDVTSNLGNGFNYDNSGFEVSIPLSFIPNYDNQNFEIYVLYSDLDGEHLIDLNVLLKE